MQKCLVSINDWFTERHKHWGSGVLGIQPPNLFGQRVNTKNSNAVTEIDPSLFYCCARAESLKIDMILSLFCYDSDLDLRLGSLLSTSLLKCLVLTQRSAHTLRKA